MFTKREVLLGGLLSIFNGACCSCLAQTNLRGCAISIDVAKKYLGDLTGKPETELLVVGKSGNREFDYAAAQTLAKLSDLFNVLPGFAYFKNNSLNAFATPGVILGRNDGSVLFGRDLLFSILKSPESPDAIFSGICAHEFGHILQFKRKLTLDDGQFVKRSELHADFLAGYFAGVRKLEKPDFPAAVIAVAHEALGDYNFQNPQHHGTPKERSNAIVTGFNVAYLEKRNTTDAFQISLNYIKSL